jgi:hypothetical protein
VWVSRQEADLLGAHVAVALGRREDFDVARGFRHEVVDGVLGERGELLRSVGGRGSGAHRAEGVDGCRGATGLENSGALRKQKRRVFIRYGMQFSPRHSVTGAKAREKEIGI